MNKEELLQVIKQAVKDEKTYLSFSDKGLIELPPEIGQLINLQWLILDNNQLTTLPSEIGQLVKLRGISLNNNQLTVLPQEIGQLVNLQTLNLNNNQLTALPLKIIQLVNLQELKLNNNQLIALPRGIIQLVKLQWLVLKNNQLMTLPPGLRQLVNLQKLELADNQLRIPPEILVKSSNPAKIINYYLQVQKDKIALNEAKILIVGQGAVGKTSLVNRLTKDVYNDAENKTEGIQIRRWWFEVGDENIRLNIWDFGGQEIMHATHQFFLTKRSLYILVLDARQGEQESRIEYWLKLIQSFGGDSPIIVAINKSDEHLLDINKRGLKAKYSSLKKFFDISCKTGAGILELIENIKYQIDKLEHVYDPVPGNWFIIKQTLENISQDFISYDKYVQMCRQQGISDELSQQALIGFLHDLGIVLNFREDKLRPQLCDTNILNPEWVTKGVYKLLNSFELHQDKGILKVEQLGTLLDAQRYPQDHQLIIVEMMEKFELCFEIPGTNRQQFLIPELLSKEELDVNWDYANSLAFQYHYDVLPSSIMSRFIVRMQQLISKKTYWHSGVVLALKDNKALVKSDIEDKKIFIWISGKPTTRREFLTVIRQQFQYLHQSIPKINAIEQVPYKTVIIPYRDLIGIEKMGEEFYIIPSLEERVPISQLLAGIEKIEQVRRENHTPAPIEEPASSLPEVKKDNWDRIMQFSVLIVTIIGVIATIVAAIAAVLALF